MKDLGALLDRFAALADSPRNRRLAASEARISFHVGLGRSVWKRVLGFSLLDYFEKPEVTVEAQLRWKLFWHDSIPDDTPIAGELGLDYGVALEPSLFGVGQHFSEDTDPMYAEPVIKERGDLGKLRIPDFRSSGLMPRIHRHYDEMVRLAAGKVPVRFPGWARGPWSVACMLRGFNELYLDVADDPGFVRELLDFIVESRIAWERQRCAFLGIDVTDKAYEWQYVVYRRVTNSEMFNDEVDGALFSPDTYAGVILPAERKLRDFYGATRYYHSCGNMTPFLPALRALEPELMHISRSTDAAVADAVFPASTRFQCCMHSIDDVLDADEARMASSIASILSAIGKERRVEVWADAIYRGGLDSIDKVQAWLRAARGFHA